MYICTYIQIKCVYSHINIYGYTYVFLFRSLFFKSFMNRIEESELLKIAIFIIINFQDVSTKPVDLGQSSAILQKFNKGDISET